jgi:Bacterial Ig-like domain (group 2)
MPKCDGLGKFVVLLAMVAAGLFLEACGGGSTSGPLSGPSTLSAIQITPSNSLLPLSGTRQLIATGIYSDGTKLDLTSQVTWSASSTPSTANFVTVNSSGLVTANALGATVILATKGNIVGTLQLLVDTNGFSSAAVSTVTVTYLKNDVDLAYVPQNQTLNPQGVYTLQVVNLEEDLFSATLPVPTALIYSVPMPAGYVPNATAASQTSLKVAVISYSSPNVLVIDASNDPTDLSSNTIVGSFSAPLSKKVTFSGTSCMICAAVVNPANDQLLLSTSQGYYAMDLTTGVFTALPLVPPAFASPSFTLNPTGSVPYILSPTYGQDPNFSAELQTLDLASNAVTDFTSLGLISPSTVALNFFTSLGVVTDASASAQALLNVTSPQSPSSTLVSAIGSCTGAPLSMAALGVAASGAPAGVSPTLFLSQPSGNCVGLEVWPAPNSSSPFVAADIAFGYGALPVTPDGKAFGAGNDLRAIGTFTSVVDKKNYGYLVDSTQNWIAKINLGYLVTNNFTDGTLPLGINNSASLTAGVGGDPVVFLSTAAQDGVVNVIGGSPIVDWVSASGTEAPSRLAEPSRDVSVGPATL